MTAMPGHEAFQNASSDANDVFTVEAEIQKLGLGIHSSASYADARDALVATIGNVCHFTGHYSGANLERVLSKVETATTGHRVVAVLLIRCISIEGLLPLDDPHGLVDRKILNIIESHAPDLMRFAKIEKQQTYEKLNILRSLHSTVCSNYTPLATVSGSLSEIASQKNTILKCLRHNLFLGYMHPFNIVPIKIKLESICEGLEALSASGGADYKTNFDDTERAVSEAMTLVQTCQSFFTDGFVSPFLIAVSNALEEVKSSASEKFRSTIESLRSPPKCAEKKYPLHQVDRYINFTLPMVNKGPSTAVDVVVEIDCGLDSNIALENDQLCLGDVPPGNFAMCFGGYVIKASKNFEIAIEVSWGEVFGSRQSCIFEVKIEGQNETVDWASLESLEPYSLEVAEGDMFVGRVAKVKAIANKLLKRPMTSSYITGQKRIGKTSLARAVANYLVQEHEDFHSLYLEYGEYCSATPQKTLRTLGENIYSFLSEFLSATEITTPDFSESIADLNIAAKKLEAKYPNRRFVIILDEFDEIHPELYRSGPLAETFFANLRTLAARKNLAFILVGGEKMPFIIGAQGDQLNKFSREPLDYFSRSSEWTEYLELISKPVEGILNWDAAAINELFTLTHGHPYYTKLLCSKVVSAAVAERDTEIIAPDISRGLTLLLPELDTNAFAHLWKDGISFERDLAEVTELKRLRLLVGIGRSLREHKRKEDDVKQHAVGAHLPEHEITPLLSDFQRREILYERNGELFFTVPIFEAWLTEFGLSKLITSTLGDELEASIKQAEDKAHVTSTEIQQLVTTWPTYRAQKINAEQVRAWLDQLPLMQNQRLMFKTLQHIRFLSPVEIEDHLKLAHDRVVRPAIGALTITRKTDRRTDLWITYVDGAGKSGQQYAREYAKTNAISLTCILDHADLLKRLNGIQRREEGPPKALIVVDDVVGSGETLSKGVAGLVSPIAEQLSSLKIPLLAIALVSTEEGEKKVTAALSKFDITSQFYPCEIMASEYFAFPKSGIGFWSDADEMHRAKALCQELGAKLYKSPLGFQDQGLLLVLPATCPNNSLPVLFREKAGATPWVPLFPRPIT